MIIGIIAEFNPLHNGHQLLIDTAKKRYPHATLVCVMSGNFVQRGEPAICDKRSRTQMALQAGMDLVVELPFVFATRSAYYFADGAISLLNNLGVTHLLFGSEWGQLEELEQIAAILSHEPAAFQQSLHLHLSQGMGFPQARAKALQAYTKNHHQAWSQLLLGPNNILAIEYLKVLHKRDYAIKPLTIPRQGSSYHSLIMKHYASASAIRQSLYTAYPNQSYKDALPNFAYHILQQEITLGRAPILPDALEQALFVKLRTADTAELKQINDINEGLENRIQHAANTCGTIKELKEKIKSKRYSATRISRILLHTLLSFTQEEAQTFDQSGPMYIHILGFSSKGQETLHHIKKHGGPLTISRAQNIKAIKKSADPVWQMLRFDLLASNLYSLCFPSPTMRTGGSDYTASPVRI